MMPIRLQRYIAFLSLILFAGKLWAWYLTHSVTILTDALESTVNVIAGFIGLYSVILAAKPRDVNHPYGHGKIEFVSAAIEGSLIFIAGLMIMYQAAFALIFPKPIHKLDVGIYITGATGIINFLVGIYAIRQGNKHKSLVVASAGRHLRADAYSTFAIVIGLGLLIVFKKQWLDSVVALAFAGVILVTGYKVVRKSLAGIMDEADETLVAEMIAVLQNNRKDQWIDMHNLRVIQYGEVLHVDTHMTLPWYYQVAEAEKEIHDLEDLIRKHFGSKIELFIHIDACAPYSCKLCALKDCPVRRQDFQQQLQWNMDNVWANQKHGKEGLE
ncbi:MAG: cation transporter [Sphingobacteriales bacterium]|nr:MAG: cation transporter [Sphingobacteriales bacterium]